MVQSRWGGFFKASVAEAPPMAIMVGPAVRRWAAFFMTPDINDPNPSGMIRVDAHWIAQIPDLWRRWLTKLHPIGPAVSSIRRTR